MSKNQMKFITLVVFSFITMLLFAPIGNVQAGYEPVQYYTGASFLVTGDFTNIVDVRRTITLFYVDTSGQDQSASFEEILDCTLEGDAQIDGQALQLGGLGDFVSCEISDYAERVQRLAETELGKAWSGFVNPQMNGIWAEATFKVEKQDTWMPILSHSTEDVNFQVYDGIERGDDKVKFTVQGLFVPYGLGFDFTTPAEKVRGEMPPCGSSTCNAYFYLGGTQIGQGVSYTNVPAYIASGTTHLFIGGDGGGFTGSIESFAWDPNSCPGCY